jgi:hypothetical protein
VSDAMPVRKKLRIRLRPYKPAPEPLPVFCAVCGQMKPAWHYKLSGHPRVCGDCHRGSGKGVPFSSGPDWEKPAMGYLDCGVMNAAMAVIRRLKSEATHG